jgi:acetyl-CoA acetyltransferase
MKASRFGGHSTRFGAPEAEMDLPYGHMAQNTGCAMIAQRYGAIHGLRRGRLAHQRGPALQRLPQPRCLFYGQPITVDDVLNSRMVADPLHAGNRAAAAAAVP